MGTEQTPDDAASAALSAMGINDAVLIEVTADENGPNMKVVNETTVIITIDGDEQPISVTEANRPMIDAAMDAQIQLLELETTYCVTSTEARMASLLFDLQNQRSRLGSVELDDAAEPFTSDEVAELIARAEFAEHELVRAQDIHDALLASLFAMQSGLNESLRHGQLNELIENQLQALLKLLSYEPEFVDYMKVQKYLDNEGLRPFVTVKFVQEEHDRWVEANATPLPSTTEPDNLLNGTH